MKIIGIIIYCCFCLWYSITKGQDLLLVMAEAAAIKLFFPKLFSDEKPVSTLKSQKIIGFVTKRLSPFSRNHFHFSIFLLPDWLLSTYQKQTKQIDMKKKTKTAGKTAPKKGTTKKAAVKKVVAKKEKAPSVSKDVEEVKEVKEKQVQNRDTTTYNFNGEKLGKGPFVLALVKDYVKKHTGCTEAKLKEMFPDTIIGRYGVFADLKTAISKSKTSGKKRYFINEDQIFKLGGKEYAVTNQWTAALMEKLLTHLKEKNVKFK